MKKYLITLAVFLSLSGCGGGGSDSGSGGGNLLGTWTGTTSSSVIVLSSPVTLFITSDDGQNIAGRAVIPNSPCFPNATFAGTRNGNTIDAGMVNGPNVLATSLVVSGNTMSGSYLVTNGVCGAGDAGTVNLSR